MKKFDLTTASNDEILQKYKTSLFGKAEEQSMMMAGLCAGELCNRGIIIDETSDNPEDFKLIITTEKVA